MKDELKDIEDELSSLGDTIAELADKVEPLFDFRDMGKQIEKLKKVIPTAENIENMKGEEGETCMHGNSWHSECSLCNSDSLIDDVFELVESTPNDAELGAKMRELYHSYSDDSDDTEE